MALQLGAGALMGPETCFVGKPISNASKSALGWGGSIFHPKRYPGPKLASLAPLVPPWDPLFGPEGGSPSEKRGSGASFWGPKGAIHFHLGSEYHSSRNSTQKLKKIPHFTPILCIFSPLLGLFFGKKISHFVKFCPKLGAQIS